MKNVGGAHPAIPHSGKAHAHMAQMSQKKLA